MLCSMMHTAQSIVQHSRLLSPKTTSDVPGCYKNNETLHLPLQYQHNTHHTQMACHSRQPPTHQLSTPSTLSWCGLLHLTRGHAGTAQLACRVCVHIKIDAMVRPASSMHVPTAVQCKTRSQIAAMSVAAGLVQQCSLHCLLRRQDQCNYLVHIGPTVGPVLQLVHIRQKVSPLLQLNSSHHIAGIIHARHLRNTAASNSSSRQTINACCCASSFNDTACLLSLRPDLDTTTDTTNANWLSCTHSTEMAITQYINATWTALSTRTAQMTRSSDVHAHTMHVHVPATTPL
jgi:hypothetical protein